MSAGRLYDKIGDRAKASVLYVLHSGIICRVSGLHDDEMPASEIDDSGDELETNGED